MRRQSRGRRGGGGRGPVALELTLCSGRCWHLEACDAFASGPELRARAAAVSDIPEAEVVLVCGNDHITDEEAPLLERAKDLRGSPLRVTLVRMQKHYALVSHSTGLQLWDVRRAALVRMLAAQEQGPAAVAMDWPRQCALSGGTNGDPVMRLWDLGRGTCVERLVGHEDEVVSLAVDWAAKRALSGGRDHSIRLWDLGTARNIAVISCKSACTHWREYLTPLCLDMHWPSRRAISGMDNGCLKFWDLETSTCTKYAFFFYNTNFRPDPVPRDTTCLEVDWAKERAVTGSADKTLKLWDTSLDQPKCLLRLHGHTGPITGLAVDWAEQRALSSAAGDPSLRLWSLSGGECLRQLPVGEQAEGGCGALCLAVDWPSGVAASGSSACLHFSEIEAPCSDQGAAAEAGTSTIALGGGGAEGGGAVRAVALAPAAPVPAS